jgi:hypothetical protein
MLLAIAGIVLIVGLLGCAAFFAAKEELEAMRSEEDILARPMPRAHSH